MNRKRNSNHVTFMHRNGQTKGARKGLATPVVVVLIGLALLVGLLVGRFALPSGDEAEGAGEMHADEPSVPEVWTCSMHPQIQQPQSGDCPICAMDLIPLTNDSDALGPREMTMSASARALADIETALVERAFPEAEVKLVGKLAYDETRLQSLTARFPARIDRLFVNYNGVPVKKGEHLAVVYSPELLTAQRELITAHARDPESAITRAAREKLRLWDLLPDQIEAILESGEAKDNFVLRAPIEGVVIDKHVKEGDYVKTGEALFKIVDLSQLWLSLNAFESDLVWLRFGQQVDFTVESYPGETFQGQIAFIEPLVNPDTRTIPVRVNVPNAEKRLKPGMFARGVVYAKVALGGKVFAPEFAGKWISPMHPEIVKDAPGQCDVCGMDLVRAEELGYVEPVNTEAPLIVPASAVLRTGKRAVVYVEKMNTETPTFEGREILLGPRAGDVFIVESGLEAGDRVVTRGAFKIDSALQIKAKPSMMSPMDGDDALTHDHATHDALELSAALAEALVPEYLKLQSSLAEDDLSLTKEILHAMLVKAEGNAPLTALLQTTVDAKDLTDIRRPYFETLSNAFINTLQQQTDGVATTLYLMHCPMVYDNRGADWIQSTDELTNPYFGDEMYYCGEVKGKLVAGKESEVRSQESE